MHRTGYESASWQLVHELWKDRLAAAGLVGLWSAGWLALALAVFAPVG